MTRIDKKWLGALGAAGCIAALGGCGKTVKAPEADAQVAADVSPATPNAPDAVPTAPADVAPATPNAADAAPSGDAGDELRGKRPEARPIAPLKLPTVEQWKLGNGLEVFLLASDTLPTVSMSFEFDVGAIDDPVGKSGLASVCLDLFSEGTERLDKVAWSEALADHAVSIFSPAGLDVSTIAVRSLERELPAALDLLAELLRSPGMRQEDFDRIIADRKAALAQSRATAAGIASRLFGGLVWGMEHPYGRVQVDADLDAMKLADCKAWVGQIKPEGARLWVAGKVTREGLDKALGERLASWTGKAPTAATIAPAPAPSGTIYAVQVDGAVQSMIVVGHPGPARAAADYESTYMMAQIFGGSFSSRINMNLREKHGFAYGSSGRYTYRRGGSHFAASASVETSTTGLALREMANEIKAMREAPPSAEELAREQEGALLALPARFAKASSALDELRSLAYFGLPLDWFGGHEQRLREVTVAAVNEAAKAHLVPGDAVVLVVGDLTKPAKDADGKTVREVLEQLAADKVFGPGGLVLLDADGKLVK